MLVKEPVYLFGAAEYGRFLFNVLEDQYDIIGFIDNDVDRRGEMFCNKKVYTPEILNSNKAKVIIASSFWEEIEQQLSELGVKDYSVEESKNYKCAWPVNGYLTKGDEATLMRFAAKVPENGKIVEVGVYKGLSTYFTVKALKENDKNNVKVYAVDTFKGSDVHQNIEDVKQGRLKSIFIDNMNKYKCSEYVETIENDSVSAAKEFEDNFFDQIFIDADHSYESVRDDLAAWWSKLKSGGVMLGHDFTDGWPGVKKAVKEFCGNYNLTFTHEPAQIFSIIKSK